VIAEERVKHEASDESSLTDDERRASELEALAHTLASQHQKRARSAAAAGTPWVKSHLDRQEKILRAAYDYYLAEQAQVDLPLSHAAEWLLDNFFLVQQTVRQTREDIPDGYFRELPLSAGTGPQGGGAVSARLCSSPGVYSRERVSTGYRSARAFRFPLPGGDAADIG
jgi:cyclic beta-1,2-glucan synthetase